jgi:CheY-like chemotaxis protein
MPSHDIRQGLEAGFLSYLTKPSKVNEFMAALDEALEFVENKAEKMGDPNDSE